MISEVIQAHLKVCPTIFKAVPGNLGDLTRAPPDAIPVLPPDLQTEIKDQIIITISLAILQLTALNDIIDVKPILWTFSPPVFQMTLSQTQTPDCF